jgi:hypothetical protein
MTGTVLRSALAVALGLLWLVGPLASPDVSTALGVESSTTPEDLAEALVQAAETGVRILYADSVPPSAAVSALLAGEARRTLDSSATGADSGPGRVTLTVPGSAPRIELTTRADLVAERRASLDLVVRGAPSTDAVVALSEGSGLEDTIHVTLDPSGTARTSIGIEPHRAGAAEWTARMDGAVATARAWVRPASTVRALVLTGPPGNESRQLVRSLEAAGVDVALRQDLGRALTVESAGVSMPEDLVDLEPFDVVVVIEPVAAPMELLLRWVVERGGGLLRLAAPAVDSESISRIEWTGPAEVLPLPAADIQTRARRVVAPPGGIGFPVARRESDDLDGAVYARADWLGRGRVYTSGLQSWPWVMEVGAGAAHRSHWESIVEWLSGGLVAEATLRGTPAVTGLAWTGRIDGPVPESLALRRPSTDRPASPADRELLTTPTLLALPVTAGAHTLSDAGDSTGTPIFGFVAGPAGASSGWADAALRVGGAGGTVTVADAADASVRPVGNRTGLRWLLFLLVGALAGTGWATRRIAGLP